MRRAHIARSRGDSVPRLRGWGSIFVLRQWLGVRFTAAARSSFQGRGSTARFLFFAAASLATAPSLRPRLTETGGLEAHRALRSDESQGEWPRTPGSVYGVSSPGLSRNALELGPNRASGHLSFAIQCGQHQGREWSTFCYVMAILMLRVRCSFCNAHACWGKAAYSEF